MLGVYRSGSSPMHRCGAGIKLVAVLVVGVVTGLAPTWWTLAGVAALVVLGYNVAGFGARDVVAAVWPLRWLLPVIVVTHAWSGGWSQEGWARGSMVVVGLLVVTAAATVVTLTTEVSAMIDSLMRVLRPLRRWGVQPERVALLLALTTTLIPTLLQVAQQTREAARARGLDRGLWRMLPTLIVRIIRHADLVGSALAARGVDDPAT